LLTATAGIFRQFKKVERNVKIENEKLENQPRKAQKLKLPNEPIFF
jgi:hypothetical protein